jgi:hypothetical protein
MAGRHDLKPATAPLAFHHRQNRLVRRDKTRLKFADVEVERAGCLELFDQEAMVSAAIMSAELWPPIFENRAVRL